ncbi:hypothetical protein Tco_0481930 [Tanacetum coccineum]
MQKGRLTTKGRLMIHPETTMAINNNPSRDRMSPRSTIWGRVKRSRMVDLCPSAPSAIFITMACALKMPQISQGMVVFECGAPRTFKKIDKMKNKTEGNRNAQGWVYAAGNAEKNGNASRNPDSNVVMGTFYLNSRYASILFDTGADRSFKSTAFIPDLTSPPTLLRK